MSRQEVRTTPEVSGARPAAIRFTRRGRRATPKGTIGRYALWWWAIPGVALVLFMHYYADGAGSVYAFTDYKGLGAYNWVGFDNFVAIFHNSETLKALANTLVLAVGFLVITNVLGLLFALALNRTLKSRHVLRVLLFMPVVLSPLAVSYIWRFIFQPQGPLNDLLQGVGLQHSAFAWLGDPRSAVWTILVVMVWQNVGLTMVIYLAGLSGVPPELEEAAAVDGAGPFRRLVSVTLPQLRPTIIVGSTLLLVQGLKVFDQVLSMTNGGPFGATDTVSTVIYRETFANGRYGYGSALSLCLTFLVAILAFAQIALLRRRQD